MGCGGGYRDLFRMIEGYGHSSGGCGSNRQSYHDYYQSDDIEEKLIIIKKMYAEDLIDDEEFQRYKQRIYDRSMSFDELVAIKKNRSSGSYRKAKFDENKSNLAKPYSKYKDRLKKLYESKERIIQIQDKLSSSIQDLEKEKKRMEALAETMLRSSDEIAEKYINKKIDIEESIQNLTRRNKELQLKVEEVDGVIKDLEIKELELEAVMLQEELNSTRYEDK